MNRTAAENVVVTLMGPTASGKSQCAIALAEHLPVEIVSVDSAQVFRHMNIGTAKPSTAEQARVAHHLIDLIEPTETYSAAMFRADALRAIAAIHARGHIPLLVGGTMLYFKALRDGLAPMPPADPMVRAAIDDQAAAQGWPALHAELARHDPITAARLKPTDAQRIQRALEVFRSSGQPLSQWIGQQQSVELPFTLTQIALVPGDRNVLHARIAQRFDSMLAAGLVLEVEQLRAHYRLDAAMPSMRTVGYRQVLETLLGDATRATLRDRGVAATRQLAKRQLTWLRTWPNATVIDPSSANPMAALLNLTKFL